jgi:phosphoglycolate phosphatase
MKTNVFWDLDGTLTDPKVGILTSIRFALEARGYEAPPFEDLVWCIGPPLHDSFASLVPSADTEEIKSLIEKYRERFSVIGLFENELIVGIPDVLEKLRDQNHFLATSKPRVYAEKILAHFNLTRFFKAVYGSELSGERSDKGELIHYILQTEKLVPEACVMIGDRKHDIIGAQKAKLASIGVLWGYGSRMELETARANRIAKVPCDLLSELLTM